MLILLLSEYSLFFEKDGYIKDQVKVFGFEYSKIVFTLLNKVLAIYNDFFLYISVALVLKTLFQGLFKDFLKAARVPDSKTVLTICCKLFSMYFGINEKAGKSSGANGLSGAEGFFSFLRLLRVKKVVLE